MKCKERWWARSRASIRDNFASAKAGAGGARPRLDESELHCNMKSGQGVMQRIMHVVGARPNFMKVAPLIREMKKRSDVFQQLLIHTGQHYDRNMSKVFFDELALPEPDVNLEVGSGTQAWQTAQIMTRFEPIVAEHRPDWVVVPGDVNSTVACALVCSKLGIKVAHVEAGLRSFDRSMPEEINRLLTDQLSDLLFTPSEDGNKNLLREGVPAEKIHFVGNIMIDTLVKLLPEANKRWGLLREHFSDSPYILVTLHRPSNVDDLDNLREIMAALAEISKEIQIVFPVHPRTRKRIEENTSALSGNQSHPEQLKMIPPLSYLDFLALESHAALVLSDSGGVQEETTYLGIPCLTMRPNTERPVTIASGTNRLIPYSDRHVLLGEIRAFLNGYSPSAEKSARRPALWDGNTAERIVHVFLKNIVD